MNRRVIVVSNIRTVGWVTILAFSCATYYALNSLLSGYLIRRMSSVFSTESIFEEPYSDISAHLNYLNIGFLVMVVIGIFGIFTGKGVVTMKKRAVVGFHVLSFLIVSLLIGGLTYLVVWSGFFEQDTQDEFSRVAGSIRRYGATSIGVFVLLVSWLLTRINLMLFGKEYRREMN